MKFVLLYKCITLTVQGKCVKCTRVYKLLISFVRFLNNLSLTLRRLLIFFFLLFLPNYAIKTFPTKINTKEIKLKSIIFELFIISKLSEIYIFIILPL